MTWDASQPPCYLAALGIVNALGGGKEEVARGLFAGDTAGLVVEPGWMREGPARIGKVRAPLPEAARAEDASRNAALLMLAIDEIRAAVEARISRHGPHRIGVVIGSSTSGIAEGEAAVAHHAATGAWPPGYRYRKQELGQAAAFVAGDLGARGPAYGISTACTSSGYAIASARRLLRLGICDTVVAGGADSLCRLTAQGFAALASTSDALTNPMSRNRRGINIGEGAALFVVTREPGPDDERIALLGVGESSDAHHMSAPDPRGTGAIIAMLAALDDAGLDGAAIDYVNLHATATTLNDAMESIAMAEVFPGGVRCSGTKPLTGHQLGAAAASELAFCWLALSARWNPGGRLPPHRWDGEADPALPLLALVGDDARLPDPRRAVMMSNSFAFGGSNISLVVGGER